jgi:translation initiation factor 2B subunit (eIF-2B alpha/beta/delta family)
VLAAALPDDAVLTVLGWPEQVTDALRRRGDARVLVVDSLGDGSPLAAALDRIGSEASLVPEGGIAAAAASSTLVLLDASAVGPGGFLAVTGSRAAAAVAYTKEIPVWVVAGVGRILPDRLWRAMVDKVTAVVDPWDAEWEVVPLELATAVVGPGGPLAPADALALVDCPDAPELTGSGSG